MENIVLGCLTQPLHTMSSLIGRFLSAAIPLEMIPGLTIAQPTLGKNWYPAQFQVCGHDTSWCTTPPRIGLFCLVVRLVTQSLIIEEKPGLTISIPTHG